MEPTFRDIRTYLTSLKAPRYPFPIDAARADRGRAVFETNCAKCHGTYGPGGEYPNKIVDLETIGTDPARALGISDKFVAHYNATWFGEDYPVDPDLIGYQAPPLDGIWATAPYLHNGSVPDLASLLKSSERPARFRRPPSTVFEHYDQARVGWKAEPVETAPDPKMPVHEARFIFDSTRFGLGNGGHTFGDRLSDGRAVGCHRVPEDPVTLPALQRPRLGAGGWSTSGLVVFCNISATSPAFAQGTQDVAAEDLVDVRLGVAAAEQFLRQPGVARDVFEADRDAGDAVEVGADAGVVDAGDLDDVVDVVGHVGDGAAGHGVGLGPGLQLAAEIGGVGELRAEVAAGGDAVAAGGSGTTKPEKKLTITTPPFGGQLLEDLVGDVPRVGRDREGAGVAGDERGLRDAEGVGHRRGRDVGDVHEHPQPVHLADHPLAERREAVAPGGVDGGVGPVQRGVVGQGHVPRPSRARARSCARSSSMATPPSMPISEAILPEPAIRSTSAAVRASSKSAG